MRQFFEIKGETCTEKTSSHHWSAFAIKCLINAYKENETLFKDSSLKREKVWKIISNNMLENGFNYSHTQCENKFKYLKHRYVKKKDNMSSKSSGAEAINFNYFEEFEEIFGKKTNISPEVIASSSRGCSTLNKYSSDTSLESIEIEECKPAKVSKLNKEVKSLSEVIKLQSKDKEEARERRHQESLSTYEKMMQKLIDKL